MTVDPRTGATLLAPSQDRKEVAVNELFLLLGAIAAGGSVAIVNNPPSSPTNGQSWIVGTTPTGVFAGHANNIALYMNGWKFITPYPGVKTFVVEADNLYYFLPTGWLPYSSGSGGATINLQFSAFGDTNDLFYYLGTQGLVTSWSNPQPTKISTTLVPALNSFGFVNGNPGSISNRSSAGLPSATDNISTAYILIDIGTGRRLTLSDLTIQQRNDNSDGLLRQFSLSGSVDGLSYTPILSGISVSTLAGEWSRHIASGSTEYRFFKITQSAQNSSGNYYLTVGEVGLYGQLSGDP